MANFFIISPGVYKVSELYHEPICD